MTGRIRDHPPRSAQSAARQFPPLQFPQRAVPRVMIKHPARWIPGSPEGAPMSYNLCRFELNDMLKCGLDLRRAARNSESMSDVAGGIVQHLHQQLVDDTGNRACAMVRFYKTHRLGKLDAARREFAERIGGDLSDDVRCLTLLGTAGDQPEWNDVRQSKGHFAIPLPSASMIERAPMIAQLVRSLGLDINLLVDPNPALLSDLTGKTYNVFYVEDAKGSPYIPAQEEFVIPYGIRTVLGFGGLLPSGELFATILFARVVVPRDAADRFRTIALDLKAILFGLAEDRTFA